MPAGGSLAQVVGKAVCLALPFVYIDRAQLLRLTGEEEEEE